MIGQNRVLVPLRPGTFVLIGFFLLVWPTHAAGQTTDALLNLLLSGGQDESGVLPDAFRSALSGASGFWWEIPPTSSPEIELSHLQHEPATSSLGDGSIAALASETRLRGLYPGQYGTWTWQTTASVRRSRVSSYTRGTNGGLRIVGSGVGVDAGLRIKEERTHLEFAGRVPLNKDDCALPASTMGWGLRYTPNPGFALQVSQQTIKSRSRAQTRIEDEIVDMGLNADLLTTRIGFRLQPWHRTVFEVERLDISIEPAEALSEEGHELLPEGSFWGWNNALYVYPAQNHDLVFRYTCWDSETMAGSYYQGQRYGWLNSLVGSLESKLFAWRWKMTEKRKIVAEIERCNLNYSGNAEVESWPFTETAVDLLGGEQVVTLTGDAVWNRYSVTGTFGSSPKSIAVGGSFFDIESTGTLSAWKTAFGGIGHSDFQRHETNIDPTQMVSILLRAQYPIGSTVVDLAVQQFVWVSSESDETGDSDPPDGGGGESSDSQSGWPGGTFLSLRVTYIF